MYIKLLQLGNFKRFADLTIDLSHLEKPPRLVLLIGANGSGKSSIFDAFEVTDYFNKSRSSLGPNIDDPYYGKNVGGYVIDIHTWDDKEIKSFCIIHDSGSGFQEGEVSNSMFYGRSSLRQVPRLTRTSLGAARSYDLANNSDRPPTYIDRDERFENDLEEVTRSILQEFYQSDRARSEIIRTYVDPINQALERIFESEAPIIPQLVSVIPPLDGKNADVRFRKGESEFNYDLLSNGEKQVFNILINLLSRRKYYQDTIYFIDEMDLHLNTRLQYNLLKEITERWIPDNCQLWTASHSYGFINYAREVDHAAIIDFNSLDFDTKQVLLPEPKHALDVFDVAIPKESIFKLFDSRQITLCENKDDEFYNLLALPQVLFVGVRDKNEVFLSAKRESRYRGLMDRDFLTESEIRKARKKYPNLCLLQYYCFENYLYHPDNLAELIDNFDKAAYIADIERQKEDKKMKIVAEIKTIRNSYAILKEDEVRDRDINTIVSAFSSSNLETYYPFFDMKSKFNKGAIAQYNVSRKQLVSTHWFRQQVSSLLAS